MKKESNVVLYTRTEASDFRPFLNFGPDSLATNPKVSTRSVALSMTYTPRLTTSESSCS